METITTNPFLVAMKALGPPPEPMAQLETMRTQIQPKQGTYWVAAGISFTSFVLISGEIVLTIEFSDGFDVALLSSPGDCRAGVDAGVDQARTDRPGSGDRGMAIVQARLDREFRHSDGSRCRLAGGPRRDMVEESERSSSS